MSILSDAGIPPAFSTEEELLAELYRQMMRVARHKLYDKAEAGDVVQEAWVRILQHRNSLRESDKLIAWARSIASNLASNANRARKALPIEEETTRLPAERTPSRPEMLAELADLLGRMDPAARTLLLYKFYYGYNDKEIAAAMQLPVGTVKARIHRSKARLKSESQERIRE